MSIRCRENEANITAGPGTRPSAKHRTLWSPPADGPSWHSPDPCRRERKEVDSGGRKRNGGCWYGRLCRSPAPTSCGHQNKGNQDNCPTHRELRDPRRRLPMYRRERLPASPDSQPRQNAWGVPSRTAGVGKRLRPSSSRLSGPQKGPVRGPAGIQPRCPQ